MFKTLSVSIMFLMILLVIGGCGSDGGTTVISEDLKAGTPTIGPVIVPTTQVVAVTPVPGKKGYGVCVGVNRSKVASTLKGCENDADFYSGMLKKNGFTVDVYKSEQATHTTVLGRIDYYSQICKSGDVFVFMISSHGYSASTTDPEEADKKSEGIALYNTSVGDNMINEYMCKFKPGVKVLVIADICYAGTVTKNRDGEEVLTPEEGTMTFEGFINNNSSRLQPVPSSSIMLLAACQENETAPEGCWFGNPSMGMFSTTVKHLYDKKGFNGTYPQLLEEVKKITPSKSRHPVIFLTGKTDTSFVNSKCFNY